MAVNPYDNCPCGSGKKFKWCCAPYFDGVERAFDQQQQGQHEAAVKTFEKLAADHPDKPQVWGFFANLLLGEDQPDRAEEMLARAFALDPHFPMGYLLRGIMRQQEGEVIGALLLFRKAADAYPPEATDQLAQVHEMMSRNEVVLNRPVAARAALERAVHFANGDHELRQQFEGVFGPDSRLPEAARKAYSFRPTAKPVAAAATGKLSDARRAFEALTQQVPDDPAAWFNLGLTRAWLGEQPAAVDALNTSVEKDWDDARAEEAAALVEVLRCAQGMENDSDYLEHRVFMPVRDPEAVFQLLQVMSNEGRVMSPQMDPNGQFFSCLVAEEIPNLLDTGTTMAKALANMTIAGGVMRLWHVDPASVRGVAVTIRDRVNLAVGEPTEGVGVAQFQDLLQDAMAYPVRTSDLATAEAKLRDRATAYFEGAWVHKPLKALGGATPIDAAGSSLLRKRLLGVVKFLHDCLAASAPRKQSPTGEAIPVEVYDFDRLRHKIGAEVRPAGAGPEIRIPVDATPAAPQVSNVAVKARPEFSAMSAADLAGVPTDGLSVPECEEAMRAAMKLDARTLAVQFARAGIAKPSDPDRPDRYPQFACVVAGATADGDAAAALATATAGAADDLAHNGGKRSAEYAVRRGQLLARSGDAAAAAAEFSGLLDRHPDEPKFYITAAEAMLSAKQGAKALAFAERGLARAKTLNNRDLDGACRELADAARRMGV